MAALGTVDDPIDLTSPQIVRSSARMRRPAPVEQRATRRSMKKEINLEVIKTSIETEQWDAIQDALNALGESKPHWASVLLSNFHDWVDLMYEIKELIDKTEQDDQYDAKAFAENPNDHIVSALIDQGFIVEKKYGAGVTGFVLKAWHVESKKHVAIKLIKLKHDAFVNVFLMERVMQDLFAKLNLAPLILDALEMTVRGKRVGVLIMQERPTNLQSYLEHEYETTTDAQIRVLNTKVIQEMNRVFGIMTEHHLVHGDVKPDNFAVVFPNGPDQPGLQLLDFGWSYINHRSQRWPEWLWCCVLVIDNVMYADSDKKKAGFEDLWIQMLQDATVQDTLEKTVARFEPSKNDFMRQIRRHTAFKEFSLVLNELTNLKTKLDEIMFREFHRFAEHCDILDVNANAVHQQRTYRLKQDTVPPDTKTLHDTLRHALRCVKTIRRDNPRQYADDPDYADDPQFS